MSIDDWTEYDAVNILALPLHRWEHRGAYRMPGGWRSDLRTLVYSNGTEHGFATERSETVLDLGPVLRRVLFEGIRSLMADHDPELEAYVAALTAGNHDEIVRIERECAARVPA